MCTHDLYTSFDKKHPPACMWSRRCGKGRSIARRSELHKCSFQQLFDILYSFVSRMPKLPHTCLGTHKHGQLLAVFDDKQNMKRNKRTTATNEKNFTNLCEPLAANCAISVPRRASRFFDRQKNVSQREPCHPLFHTLDHSTNLRGRRDCCRWSGWSNYFIQKFSRFLLSFRISKNIVLLLDFFFLKIVYFPINVVDTGHNK